MLHDVTCSNKGFKDLILRMSFFYINTYIYVYIYIYQLYEVPTKASKEVKELKDCAKTGVLFCWLQLVLKLEAQGGVNESKGSYEPGNMMGF